VVHEEKNVQKEKTKSVLLSQFHADLQKLREEERSEKEIEIDLKDEI